MTPKLAFQQIAKHREMEAHRRDAEGTRSLLENLYRVEATPKPTYSSEANVDDMDADDWDYFIHRTDR